MGFLFGTGVFGEGKLRVRNRNKHPNKIAFGCSGFCCSSTG